MKNDTTHITKLLYDWAKAVEDRDIDAIMLHHADTILMFDVPTLALEGANAYRASWLQMFPWLGEHGQFRLHDLRITAGGDVAFATAIIQCAGHELQHSGATLTVRFTAGLEKRDGNWTVVHEHHSEVSDA